MADTNEIIGILDDSTADMTGTLDGDLIRGYSAYEIYLEQGGTLSKEEWLESLKGADGHTPELSSERTGSKETTLYADGVAFARILDGIDGADGQKGDKGDTGETGPEGPQGPKGDTGADGHTPVKGTDYWTQADQTAIVNDVLESQAISDIQDDLSDVKSDLNDLDAEINGGEVVVSEPLSVSFTTGRCIIARSSNTYYGQTFSVAVGQYSDFVNIEGFTSIDITMMKYHDVSDFGIVFYSDNVASNIPSNIIAGYVCNSGVDTMTTETRHFDIPQGAKYFRTSFRTGYDFTVCNGNKVVHTGGFPEVNEKIDDLQSDVGNLSALETEDKASLVNAINEINDTVEEIVNNSSTAYTESLMDSFKNALIDLFERTVYSDMNAQKYITKFKQTWGTFPSDTYQQVEYVGATGTQYVVFDSLSVDSDSELAKYAYDIDFCIDSSIGSGTKIIVGFGSSGGHWLGHNTTVGNVALGTSSGCYFTTGYPTEHMRYHYSVENGSGKVVREDGAVITRALASPFGGAAKFCLFTAWRVEGDGNPSFMFKGKIYSFRMSYNGALTMNLVPCYRKSDSVIGFYDTIGKAFYINSGTGTFTKGGDI